MPTDAKTRRARQPRTRKDKVSPGTNLPDNDLYNACDPGHQPAVAQVPVEAVTQPTTEPKPTTIIDAKGVERSVLHFTQVDWAAFHKEWRIVNNQKFKLNLITWRRDKGPTVKDEADERLSVLIFLYKADYKKSAILVLRDLEPLKAGYAYFTV